MGEQDGTRHVPYETHVWGAEELCSDAGVLAGSDHDEVEVPLCDHVDDNAHWLARTHDGHDLDACGSADVIRESCKAHATWSSCMQQRKPTGMLDEVAGELDCSARGFGVVNRAQHVLESLDRRAVVGDQDRARRAVEYVLCTRSHSIATMARWLFDSQHDQIERLGLEHLEHTQRRHAREHARSNALDTRSLAPTDCERKLGLLLVGDRVEYRAR
ncbi:MAG TPA: hypothetical protein VIV11_41310 [Kofleriaceae bacterium]